MADLSYEHTLRELETPAGVLRYHEAGEGPALLMLHGSGPGVTGWRNFHGNLPTFAPRFRCLILEFPGYGVSDPTDEHPMVAAPRSVRALTEGLGLGSVDVIGNSMGGVIALQLATRNPDMFRRIVTVGGVGANALNPFPSEGISLLMDFVDDPTKDRLRTWLYSMVVDRSLITDELLEERWAQVTEPRTLAAAQAMYGRARMMANMEAAARSEAPPYWAMLHKVRARTLLTWGRDDRVSPLEMALLPMRTIPNAELHVLPACGHWAMIEQREAWESAVLAFLERPEDVDGRG